MKWVIGMATQSINKKFQQTTCLQSMIVSTISETESQAYWGDGSASMTCSSRTQYKFEKLKLNLKLTVTMAS